MWNSNFLISNTFSYIVWNVLLVQWSSCYRFVKQGNKSVLNKLRETLAIPMPSLYQFTTTQKLLSEKKKNRGGHIAFNLLYGGNSAISDIKVCTLVGHL